MEFKEFRECYIETARMNRNQPDVFFGDDPTFESLIEQFGGVTFSHGLYRICDRRQVIEATASLHRTFSNFSEQIRVFGYDWLGRQFATDYRTKQGGQPQVLLLEVGAGEVMQIPASLSEFHNGELVNFAEDALAKNFFFEWRKANPEEIGYLECVGYKVPLFLGGKDRLENLEVISLGVYLELCGQLHDKTKTLREGQVIRDIGIGD